MKRIFTMLLVVLTLSVGWATAQTASVTGRVTDPQNNPVVGAIVVQKGASSGAVATDPQGNFAIKAPEGSEITISFMGYIPATIKAVDGKNYLVALQEDAVNLEQVVVIGYGTQKKLNLTGSVATLDKEYLESRPVSNLSQALQGTIPGLNVSATNQGGRLNQGMSINIRGGGTLDNSSSSPLVLIDGVAGNMNNLNPEDVADVSVLKDAGAAAIYGSRAAFGVILITTKKGKAGKTNITYNDSFRFSTPIRMPHQADSYSFATYMNDVMRNSGKADFFDSETLGLIQDFQSGKITESNRPNPANKNMWARNNMAYNNVDWYDEHIKDWTFQQEHNLSISGGSEKAQYYVSLNYLDQDGMLKYAEEKNQRYSFNTRVDASLTKWLKMTASAKFIRTDTDEPTYVADSRSSGLFFQGLSRVFPTTPVTNPDGGYNWPNFIGRLQDGGTIKTQNDLLYLQLQAVATFLPGWNLTADANYRVNNINTRGTVNSVYDMNVDGTRNYLSLDGTMAAGYTEVNERAYKDNFITSNIFTDYSKLWDSGHYFKAMVGFNFELDQDRNFAGYRPGMISEDLPTIDTSTGTDKITSGSYNHWATAGFFARLNYNYKERYLFEASLRYDGSSRYKEELRWNWFPTVSVGWNLARESFMEGSSDWLQMLKIRGSYGELGNQNVNSLYPYYVTVPFVAGGGNWLINNAKPNVAGMPGLISNTLTWERVTSLDLGLDFAFFGNRLASSASYFERRTLDMVGPAPQLPNTLGTAVPKTNNADLLTQGWELDLQWRDRVGDFGYGVRFTLSDYRNKITRYPNLTNSIDTYIAGEYLGNIWGYTTVGIAKTQAEMDAHLAKVDQSSLGTDWAAGDIMYADLDGTNKISAGSRTLGDTGDLSVIGNDTPRYSYGLTLNFDWKGIDLMAFFQGVAQRDVWVGDVNSTIYWGATSGGEWQTAVFTEHLDYFRTDASPLGENLNAKFARPLYGTNKNRQTQTGYLENGAYMRLKTLQLGYTFPRELTTKIYIQRLRLFVTAENLWTITSLPSQFDPETFGGVMGMGRVYPLPATVAFGVSLTF